jgi:hypothetical protein
VRTAIIAGRAHDVIVHEITDTEAATVTAGLAEHGIRIEPVVDVFHVLHLWALAPTTTRQEVQAIAAFRTVTDCRLAWHEAEAS